MPSETPPDAHLKQAKHNENFAKTLCDGEGPFDWSITAAFYSALHYVDSWLRREKNVNPVALARRNDESPHRWRSNLVEQHCDFGTQVSYSTLRQQSELARYLSSRENALTKSACDFFDRDAAEQQLAELDRIKNVVV